MGPGAGSPRSADRVLSRRPGRKDFHLIIRQRIADETGETPMIAGSGADDRRSFRQLRARAAFTPDGKNANVPGWILRLGRGNGADFLFLRFGNSRS